MPEEELINKEEEIKEKKKVKPKEKQEPQPQNVELVLTDPIGSKLYRVPEVGGHKYFAIDKFGKKLNEQSVRRLLANAGIESSPFSQTPFQIQQSPFTPQQPTYQTKIYRAQMPFVTFGTPINRLSQEKIDLDKLEHEEYQKRIARYQRRKMKKRV
jgi:hypothetical protein